MIRIAVVEDNPDNRFLLQHLLSSDRYELVEYEDGPSALAGLPSAGARLVLLDISLPGMDGFEVLRRIRADVALASLKVVAVTAHAMTGDRERCLAAGFDGYLAKPIVDEGELERVIRAALA